MNNYQPHSSSADRLDQWRQISFIFFDLGAMNLIAGTGAALSYSIPLYALGFSASSFWLGLLFVLGGFASWKVRRLPLIVPLAIIAIDLWNTVRMLPLYERFGYVVLVQTSFVLPLVFILLSMFRARLKRGIFKPVEAKSISPVGIGNRKEALALLTSMLASVGMGLAALLLFSSYCLNSIAEATNPFINIFHDLFLTPALLLLFPLGAALGELVWLRVSRFYLSGHEISIFIRYVKQIPLLSRIPDWLMMHRVNEPRKSSVTIDSNQAIDIGKIININTGSRKRLLWLASAILITLVTVLVVAIPFQAVDLFHHAEVFEETPAAPGTLVVSQSGHGQYRTIKAALADAASGATILVRAGAYHESVLIDKAITLTGDGKAADRVVIECAEDGCVKLAADGVKLRNLTVRAQLGFFARLFGGGQPTAIVVVGGHASIENCDVSANRGTGIVVSGVQSVPEIRNTRVHDCWLNGLLFTNHSRGLIENSDIYQNGWAGIRSEVGSQPVVRRSRIHQGRMDGVLIAMQGAGTVEDCEIFANNYNGVAVRESSSVALNHCRIFNQKSAGILVRDRSSSRIEECETFGNANAGIEVADQADAQVLKSRMHHGQTVGMVVWRNSTATVEECLFYENASTGMLIAGGSNPTIRKCIFRTHTYSAIEVKDGSDPSIEQCQIYGGRSSGIYFHSGANGRVDACSIFGNMNANVVIASGSNPQIRKTNLSESGQAGLLVIEGGRGVIEDCKIVNNYVGIEIKDSGAPSVLRSKINNNRRQGVIADGSSAGSITESDLNGNSDGAWKIDNGSRMTRAQNLD